MVESLGTERAQRAFAEGEALSSESLAQGTRLGRYELLVPVAVGGMARVWAARLHGPHGFTKLVAIKTVLPHLASDPEFEKMLVDEARIASGAGHPNVVEIYELGEERGIVYIAMEWVFGDSLSQVLRVAGAPRPIEPRLAARIAADAAAGLHAAHELKDEDGRPLQVVHRDVSPHNLLVSLDGHVKVTDFGVAKLIGASHQPTSAGQLKGKIAYMAPEQANGDAVDRRSDVFSLGSVLYEATTGKRPFRGDGDQQVLQELVKGAFVPPSRVARVADAYPGGLEQVVLRAMSSRPSDRYQSMEEMRLALEDWLAKGEGVTTHAQVAAVVRERIGGEIEKRRERIRLTTTDGARQSVPPAASARASEPPAAAMAAGTPGRDLRRTDPPADGRTSYGQIGVPPLGPPVSSFPPVIDPVPRARAAARADFVIAVALGFLAAAALGASGFWIWSSHQDGRAANAGSTAAAAPAPGPVTPTPAARANEPATPSPPPTGTVTLAAPAFPPVAFKVVPDTATLIVNGSPLPASARTIARPARGSLQNVTVHADGFDDQTITLDETSPSPVEVRLAPHPREGAAKVPPPVH